MPIDVTCPGCKKSFRVSDQFGGKKGPCPQCKTIIQIPEKSKVSEVVIHAAETEGPKTASGVPVLRPIRRVETKVSPLKLGLMIGGAVLVLVVAAAMRGVFPDHNISPIVLGLGALLIGPPLIVGGYSFLRDQELEPHRGTSMIIRTAILAGVYALIWGLYGFLPWAIGYDDGIQPLHLAFIAPVMIGIGAFAAFAALDVDFGSAAMHYGLYLLVTVLLCFVAGFPLWTLPAA